MNDCLLLLGLLSLFAIGCWLVEHKPRVRSIWEYIPLRQKTGTPAPKVGVRSIWEYIPPQRQTGTPAPKVRIRRVREYIPPPAISPHVSVDADTGQPKVTLKGRRQIALQNYLHVYRPRPIVKRQLSPLYQEKGWRREGRAYQGYYRVNGRRWRGEIRERHRGFYEPFIHLPSSLDVRALKRHPHGPCFNRRGDDGRFNVHFREMPRDVDHIIVNVETILGEALGYS